MRVIACNSTNGRIQKAARSTLDTGFYLSSQYNTKEVDDLLNKLSDNSIEKDKKGKGKKLDKRADDT